ncbi:RNA polymerase-binding protein RbpA [Longispora albida]|uniref:RNA polymerase-binding protein RbpA n=1 Tax=Longispora albida TaxID=203523 RepID=UPI0004764E6F|nr:RNA polymerase-binding protein RbpA [Longispora albida]
MASGNAIRGTRVGSGPMSLAERGQPAPRHRVQYWCANGHETQAAFSAEVPEPETWDCPRCGLPAGQDRLNPPGRQRIEPYKTHLAYVKERRSDAEGELILAEALARLQANRAAQFGS